MKHLFILCLVSCLLVSSFLYSQIPQTLSYQGVLQDAGGNIVPNGTYQLTFRIYNVFSGGSALWTETQMVPVAEGVFDVILGSVTTLNLAFDVPYWLGIMVGTGAELSPRIQLTSSAYSMNSKSVVNNAVTTAKIADGAVTQAKLATGVSLPPGGTAGGDLTGSYPNPTITGNAVTSAKINDGAVLAADLASSAVTTVKIQNGAVTLPKISSIGASTGNVITYDGSNLVWQTPASGGIGGSGTANTLPVFVTSNTLGNSNVFYSGGFTGIGASPENFNSRLLVRINLQFGVTPPTYLARFHTRNEYLPISYTDQAYIQTDGDAYFRGKLRVGVSSPADTFASIVCEIGRNGGPVINAVNTEYGEGLRGTVVDGEGVLGIASSSTAWQCNGVRGNTNSPNGFGVYSQGRFAASGTKSFQIDHPSNPANQYLNHYCTEGAEPLNAYGGNAILDASGEATIELPDYFELINKDFRYQLTPVGSAMPDLHVSQEILNNSFKIAGGQPGAKVSWRVEAVRNDRWVERYGAPVEVEKWGTHRGKYLNPELYGQPESMGVFYEPERQAK